MVLQYIGWITLVIGGVYLSAFAILACMNNLGAYNSGGVPNSGFKFIASILYVIFVGLYWVYIVGGNAPFHVVGH
jgi:hypothetical protein